MAQLQITIDLDDTVYDDYACAEIATTLTIIARRLDEAWACGRWLNAHDIDGKPIGKFKVDHEAKPSFD